MKQRVHLVILLASTCAMQSACGLLFPDPPNVEPPPVVEDGCADDHAARFEPAEDGTAVATWDNGVLPALADDACNGLDWHSGGGAQGGDTFHIEPVIVTPDREGSFTVFWDIQDYDGVFLGSQGVELYSNDWMPDTATGMMAARSEIFIDPPTRGKNVVLRARLEDAGVIVAEARAAVYVGTP